MDEFLKWLLRLSKPDLAVALLGLPAGAAVDVWFFPGGTLDPFSTGLYFCAGAVGAKYAVESVAGYLRTQRRRARSARELAPEPRHVDERKGTRTTTTLPPGEEGRMAKHRLTTQFNVVTAALSSVDDRYPADHEKCQKAKERLEDRHRAWEAGELSNVGMLADIQWAIEKFNDVTNARRSFLGRTEEREGPAGS
jgi:hypothetical protein